MCFESYIITINSNSLLIDNNSGDEAKKLSWAYNFDKHRIAFSSEMKTGIEGNGNLIKMICSGGDKLLVRKNNIDEKEVISQTTLILCSNEVCEFKPADVYEKMIPFSLKTKFVNEDLTQKLLKSNPYYKKALDNFDDLLKDEENINAVISLIFNSFKPHKVTNNKSMSIILDTFKDDNDIVNLLLDNFEITGNPKHKIFNSAMKSFLKDNKLNISFSKIVNIFISKGIKYTSRTVEETGIKKMAFVGIIRINKDKDFIDDISDVKQSKVLNQNNEQNYINSLNEPDDLI